jgi:hypothetical protein
MGSLTISSVEFEDAKIRTLNGYDITQGFTPSSLSGGKLFETGAQREVGIFHVVANFPPLKRCT